MKYDDQIEFYTCPLCGITTGNDRDGNEPHECPEEKSFIESIEKPKQH